MSKVEKIWQGIGKRDVELHHAYGLVGQRDAVLADVYAFLEEVFNAEVRGNPDVFVQQFDALTVDDSRRITQIQGRKALGERKIIILAFNTATNEAQNALLKALEEPTAHTHFFIVVPRTDVLLSTVRSRLFLVESAPTASSESMRQAGAFLAAPLPKRMTLVKQITEEISEEKRDRQFAADFIGGLESLLWKKYKEGKVPPSVFDDIALCRKYVGDRSASVKMLLEHLALVLPPLER